jgi:CheY-like chemotaxis protein
MSALFPILLVEDSAVDVDLALRAFRRRKLANPVTVVRDGEEAIDYVHRRGAFANGAPIPGLVLLDLWLPKVDGIEVLQAMKSHPVFRTVPVVVLTTSAEDRDVRRSYELGASGYVVKPAEFEKFLEVVERIDLYWVLTNLPSPLTDRVG